MVNYRVVLTPLARSDQTEFVAAVRASRRLHGAWVTPPDDAAKFRAMLRRMNGATGVALVSRLCRSGALVGFVEITNILRGNFGSACLGYYAFAGHEGKGLMRDSRREAAPGPVHPS